MKRLIVFLITILAWSKGYAQESLNDFGRIVLNSYLPAELPIPTEARNLLLNKLNQISANHGMAGSQVNPRFIITAAVNVSTKDIIAGPPQLIAQNIELTFFVGDAISNIKYASASLNIKGVGTNKNKAFIDAFKNINPKNKELEILLEEGKNKIIAYYTSQCDIILTQAKALAAQYKFEEAIYNLMAVPEVCTPCYQKSRATANVIFEQKAKSDCAEKLKQAKLIWSTQPTELGAQKASEILQSIVPSDECRQSMLKFANEIKSKLTADEQQRLELKKEELANERKLEEKRLHSQQEIALAYINRQPKVVYNTIYWR